jgi:diguanylate cyclase (GGDEF)-like protein
LQAVHQRRLLEQLALIDSLTEIPNRRRFTEVYEREWRRCKRSNSPLSLLMVDVDHFKVFNDTYGHAAGDQVLRRVAQTIQAALNRSSDFVARYGGEEFVVVLPDIDAGGAQAVAEKLRVEVEHLQISYPESGTSPWLTISLGGATQVPMLSEVDAGLFGNADRSLYAAKHGGRNRVLWASA